MLLDVTNQIIRNKVKGKNVLVLVEKMFTNHHQSLKNEVK